MDAKTISDNSRRTVCRLAFILLCAIPLSLVIYRILHPVSHNQWQQAIKANLGIATQIGSVETPLPFVTVFHDIKFTDPELQDIRLDKVRIVSGTTNQVFIEHPVQIEASALATITQRLRDSLMRSYADSNAWQINLNQTTILHSDSELPDHLEFSSVELSVFPYPDHTTANIVASRNGDPENNVNLSIRRVRNRNEPEEQLTLDTGIAYLPCWLMHDFWGQSKSFGTGCDFAGFVELNKVGKSWSCKVLPSRIQNMDLQSLTRPFGKDVTGMCHSTIRSCEVRDGKIVTLDISLQCQGVTVDAKTASSAEHNLNAQWLRKTPTQFFKTLDIDFKFSDSRVFISTPEINDITQPLNQEALLSFRHSGSLPVGDVAAFLESEQEVNNMSIGLLNFFHIPPARVANDPNNQAPGNY